MLPAPLLPKNCFALWKAFCQEQRNLSDEFVHVYRLITKGDRAGVAQEFVRRKKPLLEGSENMGYYFIKEARKVAWQIRRSQFLGNAEGTEVPAGITISVNCVALGKYFGVSDRTARTRITQLMSFDLILEKKFHGWRRNIELVINSRYLYEIVQNQENDVPNYTEIDSETAETPAQNGINFPPIKGDLKKINTTLTGSVEKLETSTVEQATEISAPPRKADAAGDEATPERGKIGAGGARAALSAPPATVPTPRPKSAAELERAGFLASFVNEFFNIAWQKLYPRVHFTPEQIELSKDAIAAGVYWNLELNWSRAKWQEYHQGCLQRIELARRYFARNTEKSVSWPYAKYTDGKGYFDAGNGNGFWRTYQWLLENQQKAWRRAVARALKAAETEFSQFKQLARGVKVTVCKRVKEALSETQLYRWHEARMKQFCSGEVMEAFYKLSGYTPTQPALR